MHACVHVHEGEAEGGGVGFEARWDTSRDHVTRVPLSCRVARHVSAATYATRPGMCISCMYAWVVHGRCGIAYARDAPQGTKGGREGWIDGVGGVGGGEVIDGVGRVRWVASSKAARAGGSASPHRGAPSRGCTTAPPARASCAMRRACDATRARDTCTFTFER